jgi:uncharacterized protein
MLEPSALPSGLAATPACAQQPLTPEAQKRLVSELMQALRSAQPAQTIELIETHISFVLLAGPHAYKIKKCVNLGFLDFTTLAQRRHFCEEELRLNRRTAPQIYLDLVPITREAGRPMLGGSGTVVDVALRMRAFAQSDLWEQRVRLGALAPAHVDQLAQSLDALHRSAAQVPPDPGYGTPVQVRAPVLETFDALDASVGKPAPALGHCLLDLRAWEARAFAALERHFEQRRVTGRVRECHGDLHLGNVTMLDAQPVLFDCLEFDPALRWTDVMSDVGFMAMDLRRHGRDDLAHRFVNAYLEHSGDYDGARVLRYHAVYRALVRAKVAALRGAAGLDAALAYLDVARRLSAPGRPVLMITHGFSGSGKTTWSTALLEATGAVRIRADVERKRLAQLPPRADSRSALHAGLYSSAHNQATQERLRAAAKAILQGGAHAILDASFLRREARDQARALARKLGVPFVILDFHVDAASLRQRVLAREQQADDASEAGLAVLEDQLANHEPLGPDERAQAIAVDATQPLSREAVAALAMRLRDAAAAAESATRGAGAAANADALPH